MDELTLICSKGIGLYINGATNVIVQSQKTSSFHISPILTPDEDIQITDIK
jgi:hypothetical protein